MHCIMPMSKRSSSSSGSRRVGDEMVWEVGKKGAGGGECRERLLTSFSSHIHIHVHFFVRFASRYVRDGLRMPISWLLLLMCTRARDLHSLFRAEHAIGGIAPIDEILMMHPSALQGPRFRSSYFFPPMHLR